MYRIFKSKDELEEFHTALSKINGILVNSDVMDAEITISGGDNGNPFEIGLTFKIVPKTE